MDLIGEGKIKILWGSIVLIGAIITQYIGEYTTEAYAYLGIWAVLVIAGLIMTTRIPHGHREKEAWVGLVWIIMAVIGIGLTYGIAENSIDAPFYTIPVAWMALVGMGAVLTSGISGERYFAVPGLVLLITSAISYAIEGLHPYLYVLFGLAFGIPMIIVGLVER